MKAVKKITEKDSKYNDLEKKSIKSLLANINKEDNVVPKSIAKVLPALENLIKDVIRKLNSGGRLFYIGSGTSGRLGIVDASECPPTYGVNPGLVIGIIAGGDKAIRKAVEFAEDDIEQGWKDLEKYRINKRDIVIGISAGGSTPYVVCALKKCKEYGITTGAVSCNKNSEITRVADHPVEVIVGPEFVTGSTRMKAGTAQKLILNMISTVTMIKSGRIMDNKMVDMQLNNAKLIKRGIRMIMDYLSIDENNASQLLLKYGSVRNVLKIKLGK